ncbi:thiamine pyrophosphate-dependent enzyme [Solimonas soli]|uniref:thiamine pyrophosphate-dependent enzyme n=1 Tax=Solimonas soli TaxID=413479 RepID=UPI00146F9C94|nr:thiamine pyrophosphate-dependent enzyme [Solimonas soli]
MTRFIDAEGQLCAPLPAFARQSGTLRALYGTMVEARIFDKKATALQRAGQLGGYSPRLGFEAIGTAIGGALRADDLLLPAHRDAAAQLLRGAAMQELFAYWSDPAGEQDSPLLPALELARRSARGDGPIALLSCADGEAGVEEGLLAAMHANLPLVVVAASVARTAANEARRHRAPLARRALAAGVHAEAVDGNDVIAVRHVLDLAVERARRGGGPTFVEALTWQLYEGGDETAPRSADDLRAAWERCPIRRLRRYIGSQGLWSIEEEEALLMRAGESAEVAARGFLGACSGAR